MRYFLLMFFLCFSVAVQAEIFKWVDANGQVHYDDKPSPQNKKQVMDVDEDDNSFNAFSDSRAEKRKKLIDAIDEDRQLKKEKEAKAKKKKANLVRQCARARDNLKRYQDSSYVYNLDKEGNRIALPSSTRDKVISNLKSRIAANCK